MWINCSQVEGYGPRFENRLADLFLVPNHSISYTRFTAGYAHNLSFIHISWWRKNHKGVSKAGVL